jgi:FixJ family two-component response regulator
MAPQANSDSGKTGTVLVVDDEEGIRRSFHRLLEPRFRVIPAESGEQAIDIVRRRDPDVVTLDLKMPGLDGVETLARIHALAPDLPVVIVTGVGSYAAAIQALRLRAFDFIAKPWDARRVLATIERAEQSRRRILVPIRRREAEAIAGRIAANLTVLRYGGSWAYRENDHVRLDYACLLANAIRDRASRHPLAWVERLVDALADLNDAARMPSPEEQASLESAQVLARTLRSQLRHDPAES